MGINMYGGMDVQNNCDSVCFLVECSILNARPFVYFIFPI